MNPEYQKILGTRRAFIKEICWAWQNFAALPSSTRTKVPVCSGASARPIPENLKEFRLQNIWMVSFSPLSMAKKGFSKNRGWSSGPGSWSMIWPELFWVFPQGLKNRLPRDIRFLWFPWKLLGTWQFARHLKGGQKDRTCTKEWQRRHQWRLL